MSWVEQVDVSSATMQHDAARCDQRLATAGVAEGLTVLPTLAPR